MNVQRRRFLELIATASVTSGITGMSSSTNKTDTEVTDDDRCVVNTDTTSALSDTASKSTFTGSGTKDVDVFWESGGFFSAIGHKYAYATAHLGGSVIKLNERYADQITDYTLLHELAHTLGYEHGDGGIVNLSTAIYTGAEGDKGGRTLEQSTTDVGESFDAYDVYTDWDVTTLGELGASFAQEELLIGELGTAGNRFAANSTIEDVHITHSHDGFGGKFSSGPQSDSSNVYAGRFYKVVDTV